MPGVRRRWRRSLKRRGDQLAALARSLAVRPIGGSEATAMVAAFAADAAALSGLRQWLLERFEWHTP